MTDLQTPPVVIRKIQILRLLGVAIVAGILGAWAVLGFHALLQFLESQLYGQTKGLVAASMRLSFAQRLMMPALGGVVAGLILHYLLGKNKKGADYMEAITAGSEVPVRVSLVKSLSSAATVVSGGSIGREGSMVQLAALAGGLMGKLPWLTEDERRFAVACGTAAGLAGAYNTPIAGALFVAEIVLGGVSLNSFAPLLLSAAVSDLMVRHITKVGPIYAARAGNLETWTELLLVVLVGILAGVMGPLLINALNQSRDSIAAMRFPLWLKMGMAGLGVGALSLLRPEVWGNGYSVINSLLHQSWVWQDVLLILVLKVVATLLTSGSGAVGGVFTPTLFMGAALGTLVGGGAHAIFPSESVSAFTLVGMSALLSAVTHAPLTAVVMVSEMTSGYDLVPALVMGSLSAYYISSIIQPRSIYAHSIPNNHPTQTAPLSRFEQ
jgi:CIC family chloride channel protein